ncbi:MAG: phenylacetate-CoA oxygenase subunit PaaI [Jatrophihabitans sp.]|nr:MAG: phenylacetate-CoA oxygenase subunit PaaI [Jatrophihabitans sp.]
MLATDDEGHHRWAFGTGFVDPLEGIDTRVPAGVEPDALSRYCLALGDDALVYSHRLQEWITRLPELEEETAVANIALDLLGQARMLLSRAGRARPELGDEDRLAFLRVENEFRNVRLVEAADADFAELVVRLLIFATWRLALFERLAGSADPVLAAIAAKGANEVRYHREYAAGWVVRLGDGTAESRRRTAAALQRWEPLVEELFGPDAITAALPGTAVDPATVRAEVELSLAAVLATATLERPDVPPLGPVSGGYGRDGAHTESLGHALAVLQAVARQNPGATW